VNEKICHQRQISKYYTAQHIELALWNTFVNRLNKKLSCRRKTARCFESLNISPSHSRALKIIEHGRMESLGTVCYSHSIVTMDLSCTMSEIKRYTGRKSPFFILPAFYSHVRGGGASRNIWDEKTKMVWLHDGVKSLRICLAVSTEYRRVTYRQTDRHLAMYSIVR